MAKGRLKKCVCCGELIGVDETPIPYKKRYAHEKCFNVAMKALQKQKKEELKEKEAEAKEKKKGPKPKPLAELKDGMSEEEYAEKKRYYEYVRSLHEDDELPVKVYALSEDYIKRYKTNFAELYQVLVYLHEIRGMELTGDIVGIIPYYLSEVRMFYAGIEKVEENNKDVDISKMYHQKVIQIRTPKKHIRQIDIESIGKES